MAYEKQNFEDGTVLEAEHLNHIEDGMVEIENEVAGKQPKGYYITEETDPTVPAWAKNEKKPAYTAEEVGARPEDWTPSAEDVGADPAGTATAEVSGHNVDADAHSDIRIILEELKTAVTAFLDVDDETKNELSEVLALIDANKTSIQEITSGKVNVKDIVDNLTTNLSKRALSAAQGVVLKAMIDALQKLIDALQTSLSNHTSDGTAHITAAERAAWNNKQPAGNYATKEELPTKVSELANDSEFVKKTEIPTELPASDVHAWAKAESKPEYTAAEVGADASGTAASEVATHNTSGTAHDDIRLLITGLTTRLNTLANSDDTTLDQMKEVVAYIKANRSLIESVTTDKISVSAIIDNLTTNVADKPLSASQGVALKGMIDNLQNLINAIKVPTKLSELAGDSTHRTVTDAEKEAWNSKQPAGNYSEEGHTHSQYAKQTDLDKQAEEIADHKTEIDDQLDGMKVTMVQEVLAQINGEAGSIFGQVNEDGTITITTDLEQGDYTIMYENEDGSLTEVGTITVGEVAVYYSIARTLNGCTSNKTETTIEGGSAWTETITANDGFELSNVIVKMGGTDVTSSVYSNGVVTISEVTGDIVITATATEIVEEAYTNLFDTSGSGYTNSGTKFYTNWLPYNQADNGGKGTIYHFKGLADDAGYTNPYKMSFAIDANGTNASGQAYCSNASVQANVAASYDSSVKLLQHNTNSTIYTYVQFEIRETLPDNLIITANQDIIDDMGYTNLADPTSNEWKLGYRISSTLDGISALTGGAITNIVDVQNGDVVRCKGINFTDSNNRICLAKADDSNVGVVDASSWAISAHMKNVTYDGNSFQCTINNSEATQIRFSGLLTGTSEDVIITVNEEITE